MPAFKILIKLKLRILIGLIIGSSIVTITKVYIGVYTRSLIKNLLVGNTAIAFTIKPLILNSNSIFFITRLASYL